MGKSILELKRSWKSWYFNRTILNILSNFIPHEIVVCYDKDPPWFNHRIKILIQKKNAGYKIYRHNKDNPDLIYHQQFLQERLSTSIESSKERYYNMIANRLNNTQKSSLTYWSLVKIFLNDKKNPAYTTVISRKLLCNWSQRKNWTFQFFLF